MSRLVIIHDTDADGIASAWLLNKFIGPQHDEVLLIPQRAGGDDPLYELLTENDSVFLVDRTYPLPTLCALGLLVHSITVIDHHKSRADEYVAEPTVNSDAVKSLELVETEKDGTTKLQKIYFEYENISVLVDTTHSACMLTHFYCMEHADNVPVTPYWFISYIEDRDMWWFKLPDSKEINAGLHYWKHDFSRYDIYADGYTYNSQNFDKRSICSDGTIVLAAQLQIIKRLAHGPTVFYHDMFKTLLYQTVPPELHGKNSLKAALVCCPFELISDLGNYMLHCTDEGFEQPEVVICYNYLAESAQYVYSIRSKVPMDWFAAANGGGGHPYAAGFKSTYTPLQLTHII
jgi:hypothetical protein